MVKLIYVYLLVVQDKDKKKQVAELLKIDLDKTKVSENVDHVKIIDILQYVYNHLQKRNDGNKVYKIVQASRSLNGGPFINYASYLQSHFEGDQAELFVDIDI